MKLSDKVAKTIASEINAGMTCYWHIPSGKILSHIGKENWVFLEEAHRQEEKAELKSIKANKKDYIKFEPITSWEQFKIIRGFAMSVEDTDLQNQIFDILDKPKPHRLFKNLIDHAGDYRQQWFQYEEMRMIEHVQSYASLHPNAD